MDQSALQALSQRFPSLAPEEQERAMQMLSHLLEGKQLIDCQENFLPFVKKMWPGFVSGKHHRRLADAFEAIARGELKRVCISIPPRSTKSEFASFLFPAWFLGKFPNKQVLQTSHKGDLAVGFGRKVRNLVDSPGYNEIFPAVSLRGDSKAAGRWNTGSGGSYYATGVGAGLAGFGADLCVSGDTVVVTDVGSMPIRAVVFGLGSRVLAFDHAQNKPVMANIVARGSRLADRMVEIMAGGRALRCTHDHPVWVKGRGYVHAETVQPRDRVLVRPLDMREMQQGLRALKVKTAEQRRVLLSGVSGSLSKKEAVEVLPLREDLRGSRLRDSNETGDFLLAEMPGSVSAQTEEPRGSHLRNMLNDVLRHHGEGEDGEVLRDGLSSFLAVEENEWFFEPKVRTRDGGRAISPGVRYDLSRSESSGEEVLLLRGRGKSPLPPHLPQEGGQPETESDRSVRLMSQVAPQHEGTATLSTVDRVRAFRCPDGEEVFNLTVEGHHNYFADQILTHNCIIDDPHDEQEAMHGAHDPEVFAKAFDWYQTGPRQRLQPGAAILVIHTRWSKQDLIGRLIQTMDEKEGADKWHIIEIPAIDESGESYWPEYWPTEELLATKANIPPVRWNAQYMQNPTGEEGALVKRDWWKRLERDKIPERDDMEFVIQSWDTAHRKTQRSDYSVCSTWGVWRDSNGKPNVLLMDLWRDRVEFPDLKKKALELYKRWDPDSCIIEGKAAGDALIQEMRHMGIPITSYTPSRGEDKIVRVNSVTDLFSSGVVWAPNKQFADELIEEFNDFPYGAHDDMVDSATLALMRFRKGNFLRLDSDGDESDDFDAGLRADYY